MSWFEAATRWYAVLLVLTWGWAPLVRALCPRLADRGTSIARPLALLGVVYPAWLLASIGVLPYSTAGLWIILIGVSAAAWLLGWRAGLIDRPWLRSMAISEALFLGAFAAYLWLRGFTPEILNTEKPMDSAFLSSAARTVSIPPPDPWFAGEPINYYYLGYVLHGSLARMSNVVSTTAFNVALATTVAMTFVATVGLGWNAVRPWCSRRRAAVAGGLAGTLLVLTGNAYAALRLSRAPSETVAADWWDKAAGVGWRASRIVCDGPRLRNDCPTLDGRTVETINEFPFFSFLLGDLHPHVMALPFTVVVLALALDHLLLARRHPVDPTTVAFPRSAWPRLAVLGAVAGSLYAMNSWDMPTYLLVALVAVWLGWRRFGEGRAWLGVATLIGVALVAWAPFIVEFVPPPGIDTANVPELLRGLPVVPTLLTAVGVHVGERTSVGEFMTVFGPPYLLGLWLVGAGMVPARTRARFAPGRLGMLAIPVVLLALALDAPVLLLAGLPLIGALGLLRSEPTLTPRTIATGLFTLGFGLLLVVELFYIRDAFDSRMNTLFKVYFQVWTLFAIAAALALIALWGEARPRRVARPALLGAVVLVLLVGAAYPVVASFRWTNQFADWDGLDGIAYVGDEHPDELAAIRWLQTNASPEDVLLEAAGCAYRPISQFPFNRASAFTGVSTVIGWGNNHQGQWRRGQPALIAEIGDREIAVAEAFSNPSGATTERYGVDWLFVGRYEREAIDESCQSAGPYRGVEKEGYPGPGWETAFERGDVTIFRRVERSSTTKAPSTDAGS